MCGIRPQPRGGSRGCCHWFTLLPTLQAPVQLRFLGGAWVVIQNQVGRLRGSSTEEDALGRQADRRNESSLTDAQGNPDPPGVYSHGGNADKG